MKRGHVAVHDDYYLLKGRYQMEPVRIAIIGVGQIGKHHLEQYSKIPEVQIVAIADVNEAEARRVAERYGIPHVYTDFREMLRRDDIQAVDVCLHNNFHAPVTIAALHAGKHVYCEKPMAGAYRDAKAMYDAAKETGKMLGIQLRTLFLKETRAAKKLIEDGKLGRIYHARSTGHRRRGRPFVDGYGSPHFVRKETAGGGALYDMGVYHIAQLLYLMGNPQVQRVTGKIYQETDMDEQRRASSGFDVEEIGLGFVTFAGGVTLDIIEAWAVHLDRFEGSTLLGSKGGVRLHPFSYFTTDSGFDMDVSFDLDGAEYRRRLMGGGDGPLDFDTDQRYWVAALQGKTQLLPLAELALNTMLISEGIYLSDRLGREVTAAEIEEMSVSTAVAV